jgi:general secretion pathway protein C
MNGRLKNWLEGDAPVFVLELALVAALAAAAAHWTWVFVAPKTVGVSAHAILSPDAGAGAPKRDLFGASREALPTGSAAKLRLVGVASRKAGAAGRAVFVLDNGKSKAARAGESIVPGTVLREVHPDHVLLERGGATERLALERRNGAR